MTDRFAEYREYEPKIKGWFSLDALRLFDAIDKIHQFMGVLGHIGEIGVHCGKSLIPLCMLRRQHEKALGVDCWDEQTLNKSGSGKVKSPPIREAAARNVATVLGSTKGVILMSGDSQDATALTYLDAIHRDDKTLPGFRLWHVDGGHWKSNVVHDAMACAGTLVTGGVILLDDTYNPDWPGVGEGMKVLIEKGWLVPIGPSVYGGKTALCRPVDRPRLKPLLDIAFSEECPD